MEEALRRRLLDLGIPAELHDRESLATLFPPEFRVGDPNMETELLAEVLAALVARGLISVSGCDAREASRRASGRHLCQFYRGESEYLELVGSFLAAAEPERQLAVWVLPPQLSEERARRALLEAGLEETDRVRLLLPSEVYLDAAGAPREPFGIVAYWRRLLHEAQERGLTGLRATGDATDLAASPHWLQAESYEQLVQEELRGPLYTALCTYSLERVPAVRLAEMLRSHHGGLVRRGGRWDELQAGPGSASVLTMLKQARLEPVSRA